MRGLATVPLLRRDPQQDAGYTCSVAPDLRIFCELANPDVTRQHDGDHLIQVAVGAAQRVIWESPRERGGHLGHSFEISLEFAESKKRQVAGSSKSP